MTGKALAVEQRVGLAIARELPAQAGEQRAVLRQSPGERFIIAKLVSHQFGKADGTQ
jgi:hypothetical protein